MSKRKRSTQPIRIIGHIGDVNPFDYSGGVILDHGDGHPTLVWFESHESDGESEKCDVYRVALDKRQVLGDLTVDRYNEAGEIVGQGRDVFTLDHYSNPIPYAEIDRDKAHAESFGYAFGGCPYSPASYTEWWDDKIQDIAKTNGLTVEQLRESECSDDPVQRAWFCWTIAGYYGWHELTGGEVEEERTAELRKRWALRFWQARKKGITVYS